MGRFERILIVEDDPVQRRQLARLVAGWEADVYEASTLAQAREFLSLGPDVVITDIRLPDGSGQQVVQAAARLTPPPLTVVVSGRATPELAFELARMGVDLYISKPFMPADFARRIAEVLDRDDPAELKWPDALSEETRRVVSRRLQKFASAHALTRRERELLKLAIAGAPRRQFATQLGVSENTCKTMIRRLLSKTDASRLADIPRMLLVQDQ